MNVAVIRMALKYAKMFQEQALAISNDSFKQRLRKDHQSLKFYIEKAQVVVSS